MRERYRDKSDLSDVSIDYKIWDGSWELPTDRVRHEFHLKAVVSVVMHEADKDDATREARMYFSQLFYGDIKHRLYLLRDRLYDERDINSADEITLIINDLMK